MPCARNFTRIGRASRPGRRSARRRNAALPSRIRGDVRARGRELVLSEGVRHSWCTYNLDQTVGNRTTSKMVRSRIATPPQRSFPRNRRAPAAANIFRGIYIAAEHAEASSRGALPSPSPLACTALGRSIRISLQRHDYSGLRNSIRGEIGIPDPRVIRIRTVDRGMGRDGTSPEGRAHPRNSAVAASLRAEICLAVALATCHGAPRVATDTQRARDVVGGAGRSTG